MSDDEDDYMSDKFLNSLSGESSTLITSRSIKRKVGVENKQQEIIKLQKRQSLEKSDAFRNEHLKESLKRPITQENKGFQLLTKMGYKPGTALGKSNATHDSAKAITEPININLKIDRSGLGRDAALVELSAKRRQLRDKQNHLQVETVTTEEYRRRVSSKAEEHFLQTVLRKAQKTCENLDITVANITTPSESWFWEERINTDVDAESEPTEDTDDVEFNTAEKLELITTYLRSAYNYCIWCGVHYEEKLDMDTNCPGSDRNDH